MKLSAGHVEDLQLMAENVKIQCIKTVLRLICRGFTSIVLQKEKPTTNDICQQHESICDAKHEELS